MRGSATQVIKFVTSIGGPIQISNHILKTWLAGGDVHALGYISGKGGTDILHHELLYDDFCAANPDIVCASRNDREDCNWPLCGCDPAAVRVVEALEERDLIVNWRSRGGDI